jgi:hypothetical protein
MRFTEAELTAAITGVAKTTLAAQSKDIRKGRVDLEQAWQDLGGYGRYQLMESLSDQVLPVLTALPDVERVVGERAAYSNKQVRAIVEERTGDEGGRLRRTAVVVGRVALVQAALAAIPPFTDPDTFVVPDSL